MLERDIEKYLVTKVKALGGQALKFTSPGNAGVPDRIVLLPGGRVIFVELKQPGKKPTALQRVVMAKLRGLGFRATWTDSKEGVDEILA